MQNKEKNKDIAILGGTFDPVHNGHIKIAKLVLDQLGFEKIIFIPNKTPPHRSCPTANSEHRLNMLKLALENNSNFNIDTCELDRPGKSYMTDTIEHLVKKNNSTKYWLILGLDAFYDLPTWYEYKKLMELTNFIVINRDIKNINKTLMPAWAQEYLDKNLNKKVKFLDIESINISSTIVRELLKKYHSDISVIDQITSFIPEKVLEYILKYKLYI